MSKQNGFSAVELLITLFVAAGFLVAAYQLYNVILNDGGATHQRASVANIAYDYLRQYEATAPDVCNANSPLEDSPISIDGIGDASITVEYSCPINSDPSITKVEVTLKYGDEHVSYATYARLGLTITDGLIAWWPLNGNAMSWIGAANGTATDLTAAPGQDGTPDGAYQFNGTSSLISIDHASIPFPTNAITLSVWIKSSNVVTPSLQKFLSNTQSGGVQLSFNESGCEAHQLGLLVHVNGTYVRACSSLGSELNDTWIFLAGVYDGAAVRLYVNGQQVASTAASGSITYGSALPPFCIGAEPTATTCSQDHFNGFIDDARIYNKALSSAEISQLFDNGAR